MTGGEQTLKDLVHEFKTKGPAYRTTVQTTLRASYTNHYRRGLIALLDTNYAELRKPLDPAVFIAGLKAEMRAELEALDTALPTLDWVEIKDRKSGAIKLTKIGPAAEPRNLPKIKNEVGHRWGSVPLIDMLKEAVPRTGCLTADTSVAGTSSLAPEVLAEPYGEVRLDVAKRLPLGGQAQTTQADRSTVMHLGPAGSRVGSVRVCAGVECRSDHRESLFGQLLQTNIVVS
ncbi:hypothetical protein [Actinomadura sp. 6N118]|uniref:hypothetical protein n=1 Tax=Actinomadura sp. 6N118 TaxID=3375151 RepID=UPI00378ED6AE